MKIKKKILVFFLAVSMVPSVAFAQDIVVTLNGTPLQFSTAPVVQNGYTLVPMRLIFESLGANVVWDKDSKTITATKNGQIITLTIDSLTANKNGTSFTMPVAPKIINGSTYVPLRFISESLDATVEWDNKTKTASIYTDVLHFDDYVPYDNGSLGDLLENIANGNVIYYNEQYWATPEYANMISQENVVYVYDASDDPNKQSSAFNGSLITPEMIIGAQLGLNK